MKKLLWLALCAGLAAAGPRWGGELRLAISSDPKTFNPLLVTEQSAGLVRYLTGGTLLRWNHATQTMDPELARTWRMTPDGREIRFELRDDARFSDGSRVTAQDVVFTFRTLLDPKTNSPDREAFLMAGKQVAMEAAGERAVILRLPQPMAGVERLIGGIAIASAQALARAGDPVHMPTAGAFHVTAYTPGATLTLGRNPYYWKTAEGRRLPYLDSIRLEIRQDRSLEVSSLLSGELDLSSAVDPKAFSRLSKASGVTAIDAGPSLDTEQLWFNQNPAAPLPEYKKEWFRSREFRQAISAAIHREDLARLVFDSHAQPGAGIMPVSNRSWADPAVHAPPFDPAAAQKLLSSAGFTLEKGVLLDRGRHTVEFSVITNAGSNSRERMAALIQQDLQVIGIRLRVVTLDFPSLIERVTRRFDYDACLLGMVNDDLDPNSQINVWLSSGPNHPWYPEQKSPATGWEAEIDHLMLRQSREPRAALRKKDFDRVQEIVAEQAPVIFLVVKNSLSAYGNRVANLVPSPFFPYLLWNADQIWVRAERP
ncbi:Extracellular solute-binding protein family 5 [Candidatus Sulfopaludibacter sp. SbA3]|nr:Extracellular solute-binding protein family 5 [Candidatus Sulfopaludibacter sp. SbA3]